MAWNPQKGGMKSSGKGKVTASLRSEKNKSSNFKLGRPKSLDQEQTEKLMDAYYSKSVSLRTLAKMFGVSRMTIWRTVNGAQFYTIR